MREGITKQVAKTIEKHHLLEKSGKQLVALSGGADSVALLYILLKLGYQVEALHCNFHLRGEESNRDEQFVTKLCDKLGIPLHVQSFDTSQYCKDNKISIEMGARELRYQWFEQMRQSLEADSICVAHHQNDQAETLLLNLLRGTGLRGLAGMHYRNGHIVRPLLDCTRPSIEKYLTEQSIDWINDSTNTERNALRNRIRLDVMPLLQSLNPQVVKNLSNTASIIQDCLPIYNQAFDGNTAAPTKGMTKMQVKTLTELHERLTGCGFTSTQENNIWTARQGRIIESAHYRLLKDRDTFVLRRKDYVAPEPILLYDTIERDKIKVMTSDTLYLDKEHVQGPLKIRRCTHGDRMTPFGMKGCKLVSDILTDLKLNRFEKEDQYVLTDQQGDILWVIGRRASSKYCVTDETKEVMCIQVDTVKAVEQTEKTRDIQIKGENGTHNNKKL